MYNNKNNFLRDLNLVNKKKNQTNYKIWLFRVITSLASSSFENISEKKNN